MEWDTDKEFLATFRAEAEERLQCLDEGLMDLEKNPADQELTKQLFREAHTLKGSAGMMGLTAIRDLSHRIEDLLSAIQKGQLEPSRPVIDSLLIGLDRVRELLPDEAGNVGADEDISVDLASLGAILAGETPIEGTRKRRQAPPPVSQTSPAPAGAVKEPAKPEPVPYQTAAEPAESSDTGTAVPRLRPVKTVGDSTIRVNVERLDQLLNLMGEVMVYQNDNEQGVAGLEDLKTDTRELQRVLDDLARQVEKLKTDSSEGAISALSQKLSDAGGGVVQLADRLETAASALEQNFASRKLVLDELQDRALGVRMLPIGTIFKNFPRLIRDVSAAAGKQVRLETSGEDCELDKRILEQVADPLMHILRNAVHHGIEAPAERMAAGKQSEGTVRLGAAQKGDRVVITVEDDGGGIDTGRVKSQAVKKGLFPADGSLDEAAAWDLIFSPGFSTAESISDISGRGVGLDVVRNNIELLEGTVEVDSASGQGTRFTVSLPVTLAVITALMVESNHDRFALPLSYIQEMVALDEGEIQSLGGRQGFLMRGIAVPLVDLHEFIGGRATERDGKKISVVIVGNERFRLGLQVGKLISEQEIVIKSAEGFLPRLPFVAGVCIMGSGEAAVVANISEIMKRAREGIRGMARAAAGEAAAKPETAEGKKPHLLVVEDSLVVRELQKNILQTAGYDVETAVDGQDALDHLSRKSYDCVITDVEMPRMSGIDLTVTMRGNEATREIPVVIVTSRASEEDRCLGLDAGANAYMMKGAYDQKKLLATIERLVA